MADNITVVLIVVAVMMVPLVRILVKHQQEMATIIRSQAGAAEIEQMRRELAELRSLVHQQMIASDSNRPYGRLDMPESVRDREVRS